jgi:hypothetical protein
MLLSPTDVLLSAERSSALSVRSNSGVVSGIALGMEHAGISHGVCPARSMCSAAESLNTDVPHKKLKLNAL